MTDSFIRTSALLLAAAISAGNVTATRALAHHQAVVAEAAAQASASASRVALARTDVAAMKAIWR